MRNGGERHRLLQVQLNKKKLSEEQKTVYIKAFTLEQ